MNKTPRTDKAHEATLTPEYEYEGAEDVAWEFARQLERELSDAKIKIKMLEQMERFEAMAAVKYTEPYKDTARLNWLEKQEYSEFGDRSEKDGTVRLEIQDEDCFPVHHGGKTCREAIDAAMETER